jgi:hypothetical protein
VRRLAKPLRRLFVFQGELAGFALADAASDSRICANSNASPTVVAFLLKSRPNDVDHCRARGVYRFALHEEADEWMIRAIAATHAHRSSKTSSRSASAECRPTQPRGPQLDAAAVGKRQLMKRRCRTPDYAANTLRRGPLTAAGGRL